MAVTTPRRRTKDPQGRMPLREHLYELRRRAIKSALAIALGSIGGWFLYNPIYQALQQPLLNVSATRHIQANINFSALSSAFNLQLKLATYLGILLASPVWLYQIFAFLTPGLTKKERRYGLAFVGAAVPLFAAGVVLAWFVLPNAVTFFADFVPKDSSIFTSADDYFTFVTRLMLAFGIAFVLPLLLVVLNFVGVLSGAAMGRAWRVAVFLVFLFAAVASPTPDAGSMLMLAFPMVGLYVIAVGIALFNDRRRARQRAQDPITGLSDDEASPLTVERLPAEVADPLPRPTRLDDDIT